MFGDDHDDRTEPPSPRRLDEARRGGYVPRSRDLTAAVMLLASAACLALFAGDLVQAGVGLMRDVWSAPWETRGTLNGTAWFGESLAQLGESAGACLAVLVVAAIAANLVQFSFRLTPDAVRPDWSRISPGGGWRRLSGACDVGRLGMTLLKLTVVGVVTAWTVAGVWPDISGLPYASGEHVAAALGEAVVRLALSLSAGLLLLAAGDLFYQRWRYERSLRMTRAEARDEARLHERNPELSRKQREAARQVSQIAPVR